MRKVELQRVAREEKSVLRNLMELYQYDFSEYLCEDVNEHGLYDYQYLDHYWTEPGRHPFLIRVDGKLAGFALVRDPSSTGEEWHELAEFFVMRKYRVSGVGRVAAHKVFALFPGRWHVEQEEANSPSLVFWRKVIGEYTGGQFVEVLAIDCDGPAQEFDSPGVL